MTTTTRTGTASTTSATGRPRAATVGQVMPECIHTGLAEVPTGA